MKLFCVQIIWIWTFILFITTVAEQRTAMVRCREKLYEVSFLEDPGNTKVHDLLDKAEGLMFINRKYSCKFTTTIELDRNQSPF